MTPYRVSLVAGEVSYDSLPVAKVVTYPLEKRDYRPFAQNILCVGEKFLHLRMWAFEVNPLAGSRLEAMLYLFEDMPDTALAAVAVPKYEENAEVFGCCLLKDGREVALSHELEAEMRAIAVHPYNGEDLQGVYWGCTADIPLSLLKKIGGDTLLYKDAKFAGNFYKICVDEPCIHLGCWYPADFSHNPYMRESMGDFEVVAY